MRGKQRRGFTLVELLVAGVIALLVSVGFYQAMRSSTRRYQAGESGIEATLQTQRILEYLRRDIEGPWPWTPCNYPEKVLRKLGYDGSRITFSLEGRELDHWISYYVKEGITSRGPTRASTEHEARPIRRSESLAPCQVVWDSCKGQPRWLTQAPTQEELKCLKAATPWVEYVPLEKRETQGIWIIGPAFWSFDEERKVLTRWSEESGFHEFGMERLKTFDLRPIHETSALEILQPKHSWIPVLVKQMMRVELAFERDADRPDLELVTLITRLDCCSP